MRSQGGLPITASKPPRRSGRSQSDQTPGKGDLPVEKAFLRVQLPNVGKDGSEAGARVMAGTRLLFSKRDLDGVAERSFRKGPHRSHVLPVLEVQPVQAVAQGQKGAVLSCTSLNISDER